MSRLVQLLRHVVIALIAAASAAAMAWSAQAPADVEFNAENARAMERMMAAMDVAPSGDVDRDFVATMVPHHQGAIDMALAELRHGHDETLRRMAQEIVVEQGQEIDAMRLAVDRLPGAGARAMPASGDATPPPMHASTMHEEP